MPLHIFLSISYDMSFPEQRNRICIRGRSTALIDFAFSLFIFVILFFDFLKFLVLYLLSLRLLNLCLLTLISLFYILRGYLIGGNWYMCIIWMTQIAITYSIFFLPFSLLDIILWKLVMIFPILYYKIYRESWTNSDRKERGIVKITNKKSIGRQIPSFIILNLVILKMQLLTFISQRLKLLSELLMDVALSSPSVVVGRVAVPIIIIASCCRSVLFCWTLRHK